MPTEVAASRLWVLSDLHLAPPGDQCVFQSHGALTGLLEHLTVMPVTKPPQWLVLNGDVFDYLQIPGYDELSLPLAVQRTGQILDALDADYDNLLRGSGEQIDLKQGAGGMTDIEFMAQYLVLAHAEAHPAELTRWSDNVRIFDECVLCGLLSQEEAKQLKQAYLAIRDMAHRCTLSGQSRIVEGNELVAERGWVSALWQRLLVSD